MKILRFFILILICAIVGAFAAHNADYIPLNFYPFGAKISIAAFFLIFICLFAGVILAGVTASAKFIHYRRIIKNKNKQIEALQKELAVLKPVVPASAPPYLN